MSNLRRNVLAVRRFNRFYTRQIGVLSEGHLDSSFSLTEVRVLYELTHRDRALAAEIAQDLGLDTAYLSRILARFEKGGLVKRSRSVRDGRRAHLTLTRKGKATFDPLDLAASGTVAHMLKRIPVPEQNRIVTAMGIIANRLGDGHAAYTLRSHRPGDIGWVIHRHGALYAQEYGWDERFEALVAEIAAHFIHNFQPDRERCWIAERHGEIVGSVFLVRESDETAKLRLLLVEPSARGLGIGKRLVEECISFARRAKYRKITLWTQSILHAAQHIYQNAGFRLVREEPHNRFGIAMTGQIWELGLAAR